MGMNPDAINGEADVAEDQSASRMDPKIKQQWVAALRSGEYKQGAGALHRFSEAGDTYCCLGVLCDLAVKASVCRRYMDEDGIYHYGHASHNDTYLDSSIVEWSGLDGYNPKVEGRRLAELNDKGFTFDQIADLIEWGL